jgi:hypothetical protein
MRSDKACAAGHQVVQGYLPVRRSTVPIVRRMVMMSMLRLRCLM